MTELNTNQQQAVTYKEGPLLILAGAGTGKTRVLTERIVYIINSYMADTWQILAVTFTNKAASEMKGRIAASIGDQVNNIWVGTFHSIAGRILRRHPEIVGLKSDFTIIDSDDQLRLIKQITADFNIDNKEFPAKNYLYKISAFKDRGLKADDLKNSDLDNSNYYLPKLTEIYHAYQKRLISLNSVDFDDLLLHNLTIFNQSNQTLEYYQNKFHYILVDEYQDTNNAQYQWLLKLSAKYQNLCAVGDDDQSIYSWRGAQIANILRFEKDFKNTKIVKLECNYRSSGNILQAASTLIKHNKQRHDKTLWTEGEQGSKVKLFSFIDDRSEANNIAYIIQKLLSDKNIKLADIAILVRAGYQTRNFEESFIQNSLPYRIVGGLRFYERKEIKDAIAYLRVIANNNDDLALERIINLPKRGVGKVTFDNLLTRGKNENTSLYKAIKRSVADGVLRGKTKQSLKILTDDIEKWQQEISNQNLGEFVSTVLEQSGYLNMLNNDKTPEALGRRENIKEFINSLEEFTDLKTFLEHVSLVSSKEENDLGKDMVNIMTVHSAKGLEFDTVFIPGLEEGVFPSARSIEERDGLEEERRLLYVAMTRAKNDLYLTFANNRVVFGSLQPGIRSRFLEELPEENLETNSENSYRKKTYHNQNNFFVNSSYKSGYNKQKENDFQSECDFLNKRIFHQKFGYGKVIDSQGEKLTVDFEKTGTKTIIKSFVQKV